MKTSTLLAAFACAAFAAAAATPTLRHKFDQTVRPYIAKYCVGCHSGDSPAAQFDLKAYSSIDLVTRDFARWELVSKRLAATEMPPKPMPEPPAGATQSVVDWIRAVRAEEIRRMAGDPGVVTARRLSSAEYNYTVRDLTGHDLQLTREFPVDPANPAGFDNSGESLSMSPALLNKYLLAARQVAAHMVFLPDKIDFAPHPMLVETDREKWAVDRILKFYLEQPTQYSVYFRAAWRYRHRAALGTPKATLVSIAAESKISARYLPMVWKLLNEPDAVGPVLKLQKMFADLPSPGSLSEQLQTRLVEMQEFVARIREHTAMQFAAPVVRGLPPGSQPLLSWKNREFSLHRRESDPLALRNDTDIPPPILPIPKHPDLHQETAPFWAAIVAKRRATDDDLAVPVVERARYEAAFARFASVFPDQFYVSERGRYFPDDSEDKGRFLSAGFHNVMGFFRDDVPLMELILDDKGRQELDRLWHDFDFVAEFTARTWVQYFVNQSGAVQGKGAEAGSLRPVDHEMTDSEVVVSQREAYLAKAAASPPNDPVAPLAIRTHYDGINATLRGLEEAHKNAQPKHLQALLRLAARAYRRPLAALERDDLLAYYQMMRTQKELSHENAVRETLVSVLMSPDFLYRIDLQNSDLSSGAGTQPLSASALASRLSYFLWASMPDEELMRHAAAGDLRRADVLLAQTRRMLKDPRVQGMATEFAGSWLMFRHFETNNSVDRQRFPEFTNELREAMFEEPIRFVADALSANRSVLDLLYGNYTFVNPVLAKHYGVPGVKGDSNTWVRVDEANRFGRGGLLPMAVFLTQNSPGLRTSPVKRGNWVVQRVLGEVIPPPLPTVPELPSDESSSERPLREMLARHRENAACAVCHNRIDSFGLAFEGYGPVGNSRSKDLAGRVVDISVTYPGGWTGDGLEGLKTFIREHREKEFVANISRKLLAYALNRSLQLSDEALIESMVTRAAANQYRLQSFIEAIVTSPQFLKRRNTVAPKTMAYAVLSRQARR